MNQINFGYAAILLFSVLIASCSQILLKKSATKTYENRFKEYLNPLVITAYGIFFLSTLLTTFAYQKTDLSVGTILEASGYIYIVFLGRAFLKEKLTRNKIIGNTLIIAGIFLFVFWGK